MYPDVDPQSWTSFHSRAEYEQRYPHMPPRIIDNLVKPEARLSVVPWNRIVGQPTRLKYLVDAAFDDRAACKYDLSRPMRRANS